MATKKLDAPIEVIFAKYEETKSSIKTAEFFGVSKTLILRTLKKNGISRFTRFKIPDAALPEMEQMLKDGVKRKEIAAHFGIELSMVLDYAKRHGFEVANKYHVGFITTWNGYILVKAPEHPEADSKGYVRKHRLVVEETIGRFLGRDEVVHHVDGDKSNNSPDNLEVCSLPEHTSMHHTGKDSPMKGKKRSQDIV